MGSRLNPAQTRLVHIPTVSVYSARGLVALGSRPMQRMPSVTPTAGPARVDTTSFPQVRGRSVIGVVTPPKRTSWTVDAYPKARKATAWPSSWRRTERNTRTTQTPTPSGVVTPLGRFAERPSARANRKCAGWTTTEMEPSRKRSTCST
jgi:hypothetical protein